MDALQVIKKKGGLVITLKPGTLIEIGEGEDKVYIHYYNHKGSSRMRIISDKRVPINRYYEGKCRTKNLIKKLDVSELLK